MFVTVLPIASLSVAVSAGGEDAPVDPDAYRSLDADVYVTGMTYVGSRKDVDEFVVHAARGVFVPGTRIAHLKEVDVASSEGADGKEFTVRCDRGELNVETNDFYAEGNVRGRIADGRHYTAPWVRYDHANALLYSDAPVVMHDSTGTFRGDGFRYYIAEERFRLLGNVSLVQTP